MYINSSISQGKINFVEDDIMARKQYPGKTGMSLEEVEDYIKKHEN